MSGTVDSNAMLLWNSACTSSAVVVHLLVCS